VHHLCILINDDGSTDKSLKVIKKLADEDVDVFCLALSTNFGTERALASGLDHGFGDALMPMDVDMQDPSLMIPIMIEKWSQGYDVILPVRVKMKSYGIFKKISASMFDTLLNRISDVPIPKQFGDLRLLARRVFKTIKTMRESEHYTKGSFA
jgi:glycosyltransferase involved in cell wall biosynthesis